MGAVKALEISRDDFLEAFDSEFTWDEQVYMDNGSGYVDVHVEVEKFGGGTVGERYEGLWIYTVSVDGEVKAWGKDFRTGIAHTHKYVAKMVATMYAEGSIQDMDPGPFHVSYPHTPGGLYDCGLCESECFCEDMRKGFAPEVAADIECVYCGLQG